MADESQMELLRCAIARIRAAQTLQSASWQNEKLQSLTVTLEAQEAELERPDFRLVTSSGFARG